MPKHEVLVVMTSVASAAQADAMTRALLEQRLAACVQRTCGKSPYHWQGRVTQSTEYYLHIKTSVVLKKKLLVWLEAHHPYDTPELLVTTVEAQTAYAAWVQQETSEAS